MSLLGVLLLQSSLNHAFKFKTPSSNILIIKHNNLNVIHSNYNNNNNNNNQLHSFELLSTFHDANKSKIDIVAPSISKAVGLLLLELSFATAVSVSARPEGVNKPELLPKELNTVALIDTANFLTKGEEKKVISKISELEKNTGIKLRVLCQSYPETPGLAVKDYWGVDDNTVVMVIDEGQGFNRRGIPSNAINLNIGRNIDDRGIVSNQFWQRLTNKLGNAYYIKENGIGIAVQNAVQAITYCLQQPPVQNNDFDSSKNTCNDLPFNL